MSTRFYVRVELCYDETDPDTGNVSTGTLEAEETMHVYDEATARALYDRAGRAAETVL